MSALIEPGAVVAAIVTYRRPDGLRRTIDALLAQTYPVAEVIVVDNSVDGNAHDQLKGLSGVTLIEPESNLGAAGGFSIALETASKKGHQWIYLLNDDDVPCPTAISTLVQRFEEDREPTTVAGVGGWVAVNGRPRQVGAHFRHGVRPLTATEKAARDYEVDVSTFSGLLVSVSKAMGSGGIRSDLFMMWEEYDLCLRLRDSGDRIIILADALLQLMGHDQTTHYPAWRGYYEARNGVLVLNTPGRRTALPWFILRQCKSIVAALGLPDSRRRIELRLLGLWHGVLGRVGQTVEPW